MASKTAVTAPPNSKQWDDPVHVTNHYKTETCKKFATRTLCDYTYCPYYHGKKERRRSFETYRYSSQACEFVKVGEEWKDSTNCPLKDDCPKCHTRMEQQFHPEVYKKMQCKDLQTTSACPRGVFCAFAHHDGEIQGKRNPEWNFDWSKILPTGVSPQYNITRKGCGKKIADVAVNISVVSNPIVVPPPPPRSPWSCDGSSKLSTCGSTSSAGDNNTGLDLVFESPKVPGRLQYTFAAILAGKQDDAHSVENHKNCNQDEAINVPPETENELPDIVVSKDEDPVMHLCHASKLEIAVAPNNLSPSFADILTGVKSRSETLPNRIGSFTCLNSASKKPSVEILEPPATPASPLHECDTNTNNIVIEVEEHVSTTASSAPPSPLPGINDLDDLEEESLPEVQADLPNLFTIDDPSQTTPVDIMDSSDTQNILAHGGIGPPPGFAPQLPSQKAKAADYSIDLFDEDFWVPLEEYPTRYQIYEEDFANIVESVQQAELQNNSYYGSRNYQDHYQEYSLQQSRSSERVSGSGDGYSITSSSSSYVFDDGNRNNSFAISSFEPIPDPYFVEEQLIADVTTVTPQMEHELASLMQRVGLLNDVQGASNNNNYSPFANLGDIPLPQSSSSFTSRPTNTPRMSVPQQSHSQPTLSFRNLLEDDDIQHDMRAGMIFSTNACSYK